MLRDLDTTQEVDLVMFSTTLVTCSTVGHQETVLKQLLSSFPSPFQLRMSGVVPRFHQVMVHRADIRVAMVVMVAMEIMESQ